MCVCYRTGAAVPLGSHRLHHGGDGDTEGRPVRGGGAGGAAGQRAAAAQSESPQTWLPLLLYNQYSCCYLIFTTSSHSLWAEPRRCASLCGPQATGPTSSTLSPEHLWVLSRSIVVFVYFYPSLLSQSCFVPPTVLCLPHNGDLAADGGGAEAPGLPHRGVRLLHGHPPRPEGDASVRGDSFHQRT